MRKQISKVFCIWGMAAALTACGQEAASTAELTRTITIGDDSSETVKRDGSEEAEREDASGAGSTQEAEGAFGFVYEGVTLVPGEVVEHAGLPAYFDVAAVPSCAFDGNDNVYHYEAFELTTYFDEEEERIYSIYFTDPNLSTTEGLCLGDTAEDMRVLYGEADETDGTACIYTRGETSLIMIVENDIVVSIEYRLGKS